MSETELIIEHDNLSRANCRATLESDGYAVPGASDTRPGWAIATVNQPAFVVQDGAALPRSGGVPRLLLVESDPAERKRDRLCLEHAGFCVSEASSGLEALEEAIRDEPSVVLSDLLMPDMSGLELCQSFRHNAVTAEVPIVLTSSTDDDFDDVDHALAAAAGVSEFVARTPDLDLVIKTLWTAMGEPVPVAGSNDDAVLAEFGRRLSREVGRGAASLRRARHQATIDEALLAIASEQNTPLAARMDLDQLVRSVLARVVDVSGAASGAIFLRHGSDRPNLQASVGWSPVCADAVTALPALGGLLDTVVASGDTITGTRGERPDVDELILTVKCDMLLATPITSPRGVVGVFIIFTSCEPALPPIVAAMMALGSRVGQAVHFAELVEELRRSEGRYWSLHEEVPVALLRWSHADGIVDVNRAAVAQFGYPTAEALLAVPPHELFADPSDCAKIIGEAAWRSERQALEVRMRRADGSTFWASLNLRRAVLPDDHGNWIEAASLDISARVEAEAQLRRSERQFKVLFNRSPLAKLVLERETGKIRAVNDAAVTLYGYSRERLLAMKRGDIFVDESMSPLGSTRHLRADGDLLEAEVSSAPAEYDGIAVDLVIVSDVTERRQLEAQLSQAQRMESVGQLAGGVAHDFNNVLTAIIGTAELALRAPGIDPHVREDFEAIRDAGRRAAEVTRQLLAFGRRQVIEPRTLDLDDRIDGLMPMLRRIVDDRIELVASFASKARVDVDPTQLEQVLINLVVNARDAIQGTGRIDVTTGAQLVEGIGAGREAPLPGRYAVICVADSGKGMDEATREKAFEPFFTTKAAGNGLGLASVYGIIRQSNGYVTVASALGKGTSMRVFLPVVADESATVDANAGANGTILLVEDEANVRSVLARTFTGQGYRVIEAANGRAALDAIEAYSAPIHLVISDVMMPEMTGIELVQTLRSWYPAIKAILISGYSQALVDSSKALSDSVIYMAKPLEWSVMLEKVAELTSRPAKDGLP